MWFWPTCWRVSAPTCDGVVSGISFEKFTGSRSHRGRPSWTDCLDSGLKLNVLRLLSRLTKSSVMVKRSEMNISSCGNRKKFEKNFAGKPSSANHPLTSTPLH